MVIMASDNVKRGEDAGNKDGDDNEESQKIESKF